MADPDIDDLKRRMDGAVEVLKDEFGGLRTGRSSPALLEPIQVDAYGSSMPMNQVGTISAPDARTLSVHCLLYTSPSPRDGLLSRMPSSA